MILMTRKIEGLSFSMCK